MSTESSCGSIQADSSLTGMFCCEASSSGFNSGPRSSDFASDQRCCSDIFEKGEEKKTTNCCMKGHLDNGGTDNHRLLSLSLSSSSDLL